VTPENARQEGTLDDLQTAPVRTQDIVSEDVERAFRDGQVTGVEGNATRLETHLSRIFLTGDRAYKFKKPVRLPFVDFSTLEQRRQACEAELSVNRRLGSPIYLKVHPLVLSPTERFSVGGEGRIIDWLVEMQRFDEQLDEALARDAVTSAHWDKIVSDIVRIHRAAAPDHLTGHAVDYRGVIEGLARTEADGASRLGLSPAGSELIERQESALARLSPLIEARRRDGCVIRGHGDLHLANICMFRGEPALFDALEFDDRLATTDRLYDLAFLLTDLRRMGRRSEACSVMNRYWDMMEEHEEGLSLLALFMSIRASVRLAVEIERGRLEAASRYRSLAFQILKPHSPRIIAIGGLSGTGKSALARRLAPELGGAAGARILRTDVLRGIQDKDADVSTSSQGDRYALKTRERVYACLAHHLKAAVSTRSSVIADATFLPDGGRLQIEETAGPDLKGLWLEAPLDVRLKRIEIRTMDASEADTSVARRQEEPARLSGLWRKIDAGGDLGQTLTLARSALDLPCPLDDIST
jgi:aminoglycoside phosphotransferase family enzyme/predicted kinase